MNFKKRIRELFSYQIIKTWILQLKVLYSFHLTILYLYLSNWYNIKIFKSNRTYLNITLKIWERDKRMNRNKWEKMNSAVIFFFFTHVCSSQGTCRLIIWPLCIRLLSKKSCNCFIYPVNWVLDYLLWTNFETEEKISSVNNSSILIYFFSHFLFECHLF